MNCLSFVKGAIESCNLGFKLFCEGLLKQDEIEYNNIPHHILKDVMDTVCLPLSIFCCSLYVIYCILLFIDKEWQ